MTPFHETLLHKASTPITILAALACGSGAEPVQLSVAGANATLYGTAQLDAAWENHRASPSPGNLAYWAETGKYAQSGEWNLTGSNTKLGLNISGPDSGRPFKLAGKIELDFSGSAGTENTPVPRLRHGYGSVSFPALGLSILTGQTWDVFSPLGAPTINTGALWFGGNVGYRRPQFRVTETVPIAGTGKIEAALAVARDIGVASPFAATSTDGGHDADIPVFEGRAAVSLPLWLEKLNATLGVSGHYGQEDILRSDSTTYETLDSWSANLDLELPLAKFASLVGEGYYGANMDAYLGGIGQGFVRATGTSTLKNVEGWGGWVALRLKFGAVGLNTGMGVDSVHASTLNNGGRTRNVNAFANVSYSIAPSARVGWELERIETDYKAGASERLWRTQAVCAYSF
jgi:hypothetical protein